MAEGPLGAPRPFASDGTTLVFNIGKLDIDKRRNVDVKSEIKETVSKRAEVKSFRIRGLANILSPADKDKRVIKIQIGEESLTPDQIDNIDVDVSKLVRERFRADYRGMEVF